MPKLEHIDEHFERVKEYYDPLFATGEMWTDPPLSFDSTLLHELFSILRGRLLLSQPIYKDVLDWI